MWIKIQNVLINLDNVQFITYETLRLTIGHSGCQSVLKFESSESFTRACKYINRVLNKNFISTHMAEHPEYY